MYIYIHIWFDGCHTLFLLFVLIHALERVKIKICMLKAKYGTYCGCILESILAVSIVIINQT